MVILPSTLEFLLDVKENNNREWFAENKGRYEAANENFKEFAAELEKQMLDFDNIEKLKVYRIYRDVRFSKDKSPYKNHFSCSLSRATQELRGGYYLQVQPGGKSLLAGGFWGPNKEDLKLIRQKIDQDPLPMRRALANQRLRDIYGDMVGERVKTAPKGFSKDHPAIDLLRYKQFLLERNFTDDEVLSENFAEKVAESMDGLRPFFDYMSEALTTDLNGRPMYGDE